LRIKYIFPFLRFFSKKKEFSHRGNEGNEETGSLGTRNREEVSLAFEAKRKT